MAKILISMPDEFLNKVDDFATSEQRTRSELIREALRTYMRKINLRFRNVDKDTNNALLLESIL